MMGKLVLIHRGVSLLEKPLEHGRITLGRLHSNDIAIDNRAVSGNHAIFEQIGTEVFVEDLNSTNGTYVDGERVTRRKIAHGDVIAFGTYGVRYLDEAIEAKLAIGMDRTVVLGPGSVAQVLPQAPFPSRGQVSTAMLEPLGAGAGAEAVPLTKVVTTVGQAGFQVASITRRPTGYVLSHVLGSTSAILNGDPLGSKNATLNEGDIIEVAGRQWRFRFGEMDRRR